MSLLDISKLPTAENSVIHLHATDNVGIARVDDKNPASNHSPRFQVDEAGLIYGLRAMLHIIADFTGSGTA